MTQHYALHLSCLSVGLSVLCLCLTGERKGWNWPQGC